MKDGCVKGSKDHPQLDDSSGELSTQQQIVVLVLMIYYSEMIQSKISKGREQMEQVQRRSGASSQSPLPVGHTGCT